MNSKHLAKTVLMLALINAGMAYAADPAAPFNNPQASQAATQAPTPVATPAPIQTWGSPPPAPQVQYQYPQNPVIIIPNPAPPMQNIINSEQQSMMGMSPDEIKAFREQYRQRLDAAVDKAPKLRTRTVSLDLSAGGAIPRIELVSGQMGSLNFIDINGNPWPVRGVVWGDNKSFQMIAPPVNDPSSPQNVVAASSAVEVGNTTASILLTDLQTPVIISLVADRSLHDARVDLRINQSGPASKSMPMGRGLTPQASDTTAVSILDGIPPKGAKMLTSSRSDVRAYQIGNKLYLRSWHDVLSPPYDAIVNGAGGVRVFAFNQASPVIVMSVQGSTQMVTLEGFAE